MISPGFIHLTHWGLDEMAAFIDIFICIFPNENDWILLPEPMLEYC